VNKLAPRKFLVLNVETKIVSIKKFKKECFLKKNKLAHKNIGNTVFLAISNLLALVHRDTLNNFFANS